MMNCHSWIKVWQYVWNALLQCRVKLSLPASTTWQMASAVKSLQPEAMPKRV